MTEELFAVALGMFFLFCLKPPPVIGLQDAFETTENDDKRRQKTQHNERAERN